MARPRPVLVFAQLASEDAESDAPKWVQVARAGTYRGYAGGDLEFTLDREIFGQVVANLRRHRSFKAGPDGRGTEGVIAWDFNHASEHAPTSGSLPREGAPAQGWVLDLEIRQGADGADELWALTRWLEPARTYIKEKRYRWASISIVFDAVDGVTGENIGAILTSIALTNTPFIEGMQPLAASKIVETAKLRGYFYEQAKTPDEAIGCLRTMLGLPMLTSNEDVLGELAKLRALVQSGAMLAGEDLDEMVGAMRTILGLPSLTSVDEVFAKASELFVVTDSGRSENSMSQVAPTAPEGVHATSTRSTQEDEMDIKLLAAKLGCKETEAAVLEAVSELVELRDGVKTKLGADKGSTKAILDKVDENVEAVSASKKTRDALDKILKAAGVEDSNAGIEKIAELMTSASELEKLMPELKRLKKLEEEREEEAVAEDVDAAMASKGLDESVREALTLYRKSDPEGFSKKYPKAPALPPAKAELERSISAAPASKTPARKELEVVIDLSGYDGRNKHERAFSYLSANSPGFDKLSRDEQWKRAFSLAKTPGVKTGD